MRKILSLLIILTAVINLSYSQSLENNTSTVAGEQLVNGTTSMTVSGSAYGTTPITLDSVTTSPGFLSIYQSLNNQMVSTEVDSLALVDLYLATNPGDTTWNSATGWLTAPLADWQGVGLDASGRVTFLDLNNNNLTGVLPESLKNLDSLREFYFYVNRNLEGDLFDFLINYTKLSRVSAHDCAFTGTILPEVFRPELLEIRIFRNQITGEIPIEIDNSPSLDQFHVAENLLTGTIPINVWNLRQLKELNLSGNSITGNIPAQIAQMDSLQLLYLENMGLDGPVPVEILNCPSLVEFWFSGNNFSGTLPDVLNMPNFRALQAGGNTNLLVDLPDNIGELTQLEFLSIWDTQANGGPFPEGIYNLINLYGLDLSNQQFTGSIDERIGNLTNLSSLYLRGNLLEGPFPAQITAATNLNTFDISSNNFTLLPDISSLANLQSVNLAFNQLQFESLLPYLGLSEYNYSPQNNIGTIQEIDVVIGGSQSISTEIANFENSSFQWILNGDSLSNATANTLNVSPFTTAKSGRYFLEASHPNLPALKLNSAPIDLKIAGGQKTWYVDNRPSTIADFRSILQAVNATKAGDTIYIAGSNIEYSSVFLNSPRVLIGPGYFLTQNPNSQFNQESAFINGTINLTETSTSTPSGTKIFGVEANQINLQNIISTVDTLKDVTIEGVKANRILVLGNTSNLTVSKSFTNNFELLGEQFSTFEIGAYRANNLFTNNIIGKLMVFSSSAGFSTELTNAPNVEWNHNTIDTLVAGIENFNFDNSLIRADLSTGNTFSNTSIAPFEGVLQNNSSSFSVDNDFIPINANLGQGAFAGSDPYKLSGLPPVPAIYNIEIGPRLSAKLNVKSNNGNTVTAIRYLYRRNNQSSAPYNVRRFAPSSDLEIEFLPNRSSIQPNQTYNLVFQAIDVSGKRSHRTYIPYTTVAANLSGTVVDTDNVNVNEGNIRLFAINPFANKYDTVAVQPLAGTNSFNFENLILGDYIVSADPDETEYPNLIPTYLGNTLDWQAADTLFLANDVNPIQIEVEKKPVPLTEPGSEISGILEEEFEDADSTLRILPRRALRGAGVSVRRLAGSSRLTNSLRLIDNDYELVAYVKTDETGAFTFPNLPSGDYRIRFEYPGVETDESSDIDFNLNGEQGEVVSVEALVEDGQITVTETGRVTSTTEESPLSFKFYPNPVEHKLYLQLADGADFNSLTIFDMRGSIHKTMKLENGSTTIDVNQMKSGTYIIRLQDANGNYIMSKMIKR